jgi:hypothetical protein
VDPKMIFAKNQEVYFLVLKCKTTPVQAKSAGICTKFKKYLLLSGSTYIETLAMWARMVYPYDFL